MWIQVIINKEIENEWLFLSKRDLSLGNISLINRLRRHRWKNSLAFLLISSKEKKKREKKKQGTWKISDVTLRISLLWRLNTRRRIKRLDRNKRGAESKSFTGRSCEVARSFFLSFFPFSFFFFYSFLLSPVSPFRPFYGSLIESIAKVARDLFILFSIVVPRNFSSPRAAFLPRLFPFFHPRLSPTVSSLSESN